MRSALLLLAALAAPASAQRRGVGEAGAAGVATFARQDLVGAGVSLGYRPGTQGRLAVLVAVGDLDGRTGLRAEATVQFLLNPGARRGVTLYGAAGAAFVGAQGIRGAGYMTVFLGLEQGATRVRAWFAEAGFGGGARLAAGVRWRRFGRR